MDGGRGGRYGYYGGGGGGRHNRNRRGGRGRGYRHQPYNNRSRGPRHGRGNRFGAGQSYQDPQTIMFRQVSSFVSRVGEFKNLKESQSPDMRSVVSTTAANINDLTAVLCAEDKLEMLLRYRAPAGMMQSDPAIPQEKAEESVGKLVHIITSCASGLPMQTPCYAALTLAVHEQVKGTPYDGFAQRCVQYAMLNIARDLDSILVLGKEKAQAWCRAKLLVRYLAILGKMGVVKGYEEGESTHETESMSVFGILCHFVDAARAAGDKQKECGDAAYVFAALVLCTLPYVMDYIPLSVVNEKLLHPIEVLLQNYRSAFLPGIGTSAVLLKDVLVEDDDAEDDEEEDEDDEDDEEQQQICDSLQDLLKAMKRLGKGNESYKFSLPRDAPWKGLSRQSTPNPEGGDEAESHPVEFSEDPIHLAFPHKFEATDILLRGDSQLNFHCFDLEGIVFGRLPIFGSAPDTDDDDEEEMEEAQMNQQLKVFVKDYTFLDRYFVAETLRDCLISHESYVSPTGVQHGSARATAEELLSVHNAFDWDESNVGLEYAILETLFALIGQSSELGSVRHSFLSCILLELTRLEPSRFSPALAVSMTNLFQDYLPALVPATRDNFSRWFAYHLINTDYQWPSAFWQAWEPYAISPKESSRGNFVRRALNVMADNVSDVVSLKRDCLSSTKALSVELLSRSNTDARGIESGDSTTELKAEIRHRVWDSNEDPLLLRDYLLGDEVGAGIGDSTPFAWPRTDALIHAIADPARAMGSAMKKSLSEEESDDAMVDDQTSGKDVFALLADAIARYKETIVSVIGSEADKLVSDPVGDRAEAIVLGEAFALRAVEMCCAFSSNLMEGAVTCLLQNGIVTATGVCRWVLGDFGDSIEAEVVPRWWLFALDAVREELDLFDCDTNGGEIANDVGEQIAQNALANVTEVLHYSLTRVCKMLVSQQSDERRLNLGQVELLEGMKKVASTAKAMLIAFLANEKGPKQAYSRYTVHTQIAASQISNSALSGMCVGHDTNKSVGLLRGSFTS